MMRIALMNLTSAIALGVSTAACAATPMAQTMAPPAACKTGTAEQNIAVTEKFYKAYETGDAALMTAALSTDFVSDPTAPGIKPGREGALTVLQRTHATFSNISMNHDEIITSGNKVILRSTVNAILSGPFMGAPATGKPVHFSAIDINTICDGKMVRSSHVEGFLPLLMAVGIIKPPAPPAPAAAPN